MYEAYFTRRLLQSLTLADEATSADERSAHLRASRHYRDLLDSPDKRHAIRHRVRIAGTLHRASSWPCPVIVSDLSSTGFRVDLTQSTRPGTLVSLQLDGLAPLEAHVVWQQDGHAGCQFVEELHPALLEAALAVSPRVQ